MSMGNIVVDHSDLEDDQICPHCNVNGHGLVIEDYTTVHSREALMECGECYEINQSFEDARDYLIKEINKRFGRVIEK